MSYVQLSEGGFQAVDPLGFWSWFSGVVKVPCAPWICPVNYLHLHLQKGEREKPHCGETTQHAPTQTPCNQTIYITFTFTPSTAAVHAPGTGTSRQHHAHPAGSSPEPLGVHTPTWDGIECVRD